MSLPRELGFSFPAEWEPHRATWLSWPHKEASWPGKIESIYPVYAQFVALLAEGERVCINVNTVAMQRLAERWLTETGANMEMVDFFLHPTDDAWCRDHGPAFLLNRQSGHRAIVDWGYNAWGGKYPPFGQDDVIPTRVGEVLGMPVFHPGIVMEGGAVEFNGQGALLTTTACLLNPNRNPQLNRSQIEQYLRDYYGVSQILWLGEGIEGDDTDGHIDDLTRFVNPNTVVTMVEHDKRDANYLPLKENTAQLAAMQLENGASLNIVELPMPHRVEFEGQRLPASYANFYISNRYVIVPTFRDLQNDDRALEILQGCFPDRMVVGLDSTDIIWGLGSFHCLSQQEPEGL